MFRGTLLETIKTPKISVDVNIELTGIFYVLNGSVYDFSTKYESLPISDTSMTLSSSTLATIQYNSSLYSKYSAEEQEFKVTVISPSNTDIIYSTDGINYSSIAPKFTDVGIYNIYFKISKFNYIPVEDHITYTIYPASIGECEVFMNDWFFTADGTEKKTIPVVTYNKYTLTLNKDYTVSYHNNILPGTANILITGGGKLLWKLECSVYDI